jgi:hypothetical protein
MVPTAKSHPQDRQPKSLGWINNKFERGPQHMKNLFGTVPGPVAVAVGINDR